MTDTPNTLGEVTQGLIGVRNSLSMFFRFFLVAAGVVTAVLGYLVVTVQDTSVAVARIDERLKSIEGEMSGLRGDVGDMKKLLESIDQRLALAEPAGGAFVVKSSDLKDFEDFTRFVKEYGGEIGEFAILPQDATAISVIKSYQPAAAK